jgi:hypothetical protein
MAGMTPDAGGGAFSATSNSAFKKQLNKGTSALPRPLVRGDELRVNIVSHDGIEADAEPSFGSSKPLDGPSGAPSGPSEPTAGALIPSQPARLCAPATD